MVCLALLGGALLLQLLAQLLAVFIPLLVGLFDVLYREIDDGKAHGQQDECYQEVRAGVATDWASVDFGIRADMCS